MKQRNIFERLKIGVKKGWNTPTLPDHLMKLHLHPLIRILRFLGGLSLILILTKEITYFPLLYLYLALLISIMYSIYTTYITYFRIKHIIFLLKSGDLEIRD